MHQYQPLPLADGRYSPAKRGGAIAWIGLALTIGALYSLILALQADLSNPTQLVGVFLLGGLTLLFGFLSIGLLVGRRRSVLVVEAAGLRLPAIVRRPAGFNGRIPWSELGPCYLLFANDQRTALTSHPLARLAVPGSTFYELIITDARERPLTVLMTPTWTEEMVLNLVVRIGLETGRPLTTVGVKRLPLPLEFKETFTEADAVALKP